MIRFRIAIDDADPIVTEWETEHVKHGLGPHTAVQRMSELRQLYGSGAAISIERTTVIPEADRRQVRFKIADGDTTMYSVTFPIAEKDERLMATQEKFPNALITEELVNG